MNELLLMEDLKGLNNVLRHEGRKGQRWGIFGASGATRFQPGAVYAKGMANPNAGSTKRSLFSKKPKSENKKEEAKPKKSLHSDMSKYSDDDLRKMTNRLILENNYQQAVQNAIQNEISAKRLEKSYKEAMSTPKKKSVALKAFENMYNRASNALLDITIDTGKRYTTAKVKEYFEKQDPDFYKKMYGDGQKKEGKKGNKS